MPYNSIPPDLQLKLQRLTKIPNELKALRQWVVWKYEDVGALKPTKVPYNPRTNLHAATNDPDTWVSFEEACLAYSTGKFDGIGFVFTKDDPFTFIDLDDTKGDRVAQERQIKIFREFNSYSEISPSGSGLHIIVKGDIPVGRKRSMIEVYSTGRYATFTGNVYYDAPIKDCQHLLTQLWEQMGSSIPNTFMVTGDETEKETDQTIIDRAKAAVNGEKFTDLLEGRWNGYYPSQSEADLAIINIIAFYTQNRNQIKRIFHYSALGKRIKAQRTGYLDYMLNKCFDMMLPPVDFDGFKNLLQSRILDLKKNEPEVVGTSSNGKTVAFEATNLGSIPSVPATIAPSIHLTLPPGLLGEIAQFIYHSSPRPVPEIALAAAIGLMSGICGRAYNVSNTGLNQYVLLLAKTGRGKEAMATGINKILNLVKQQVPSIMEIKGPDEIASGPALYKYLSINKCFVSILSEFGLRLMQMADHNSASASTSLRRMFLQLYMKSGFADVASPSVYSDKDKNITTIESPAFSILGESTHSTFYKNLNEDMILEGLLPRFLLIEYNGIRTPPNKNHANVVPNDHMISTISSIAANAMQVQNIVPRRVINVALDDAAQAIADEYNDYCDKFINDPKSNEVIIELWNRAHLKVLKLAALIAIGVSPYAPVIAPDHIIWAINMVNNDIQTLSIKFEEGAIGSSTQENKQVEEVIRIVKEYVMSDFDKVKKYCEKTGGEILHHENVVPYAYLSRRLISQASFKADRQGSTQAIKRTIQIMVDRDYMREVSRHDMTNKFGTTQKAFIISNSNILR